MHGIYIIVVIGIVIMVLETAYSSDTLKIIRTNSDGDTGSFQNTTSRKNSWNANVPKFRLDYKYVPETGYFYKTHRHTQYFSGAVGICKSEGAELAMPRTEEEAKELIKYFRDGYAAIWIGLHDVLSERYYQTLDGKPANESFVNWSTDGYPSIVCDCRCVVMSNLTLYYNVECDKYYFYVCSKHISTIGNPPLFNAYGVVQSPKNNKLSIEDEKALSTKPKPPKFRNDYTYDAESGYFYKTQYYATTFKNAASICTAEGAQLPIPKSKSEAETLIKQFHHVSDAHWVGIHDLFADGEFITLEGVPLSETYINWKPLFPNYNRDDLDCVILDNYGFYFDANCDINYYYVCAKHESTIHTNTLCDTYDKAYVYNSEADRCYKVHTAASTWRNAMKICRLEQSNLVEINSAAEAKLLTQMLIKSKGGVNFNDTFIHVDFNSLLMPDTFVTSRTKTLAEVGYEVWGDDEPSDNGGNERCGGMLMNGKLADVNCETKALFICEKVPGYNLEFS